MTEHVHTTRPARCCAEESATSVLWKLRANEPIWTPRQLTEHHPEAKNPSLSTQGETRDQFQRRHDAWDVAVKREEATQARERAPQEGS